MIIRYKNKVKTDRDGNFYDCLIEAQDGAWVGFDDLQALAKECLPLLGHSQDCGQFITQTYKDAYCTCGSVVLRDKLKAIIEAKL